jgi:CBS domain-containing protein
MKITINSVMTPFPYKLSADSSVDDAINKMELRGIRHLSIEKDGELIGIVSLASAKVSKAICDSLNYCPSVGEIVDSEPLIFKELDLVADVANEMANKKQDCAIVANDSGDVTGIFTVTDCLKVLSMVLSQDTR